MFIFLVKYHYTTKKYKIVSYYNKEELMQVVYQPKNIAKFPHWKTDEC